MHWALSRVLEFGGISVYGAFAPRRLTYWIGFLSSADVDGFALEDAPGKLPPPLDTYAMRLFASGPGSGGLGPRARGSVAQVMLPSTRKHD